jgi:hypothetical protein
MIAEDEPGWAVLRVAVEDARAVLGDRLVGVYAVGSLVHGGFAEAVSDVDAVMIVDRCDASVAAAVAEITRGTQERCGGTDLAHRLSLFWGDFATFAAPPDTARLPPIVRLDLVADGRVLHGAPVPGDLPRPTRDDLIAETAAFAADWLARPGQAEAIADPALLLDRGRRAVTKAVLFPVRFLATIEAGLAGSNDEAVAWYVAAGRPHAALATAALTWRTTEIEDEAEAARLLADLPALYAEAQTALLG